MKKRATMVVKFFVSLVIGIIITLILLFVAVGPLYGLFSGKEIDEASSKSLNELMNNIHNPEIKEAKIPFYISPEYVLVSFNKTSSSAHYGEYFMIKPKIPECEETCLCLCEMGRKFDKEDCKEPLGCFMVPEREIRSKDKQQDFILPGQVNLIDTKVVQMNIEKKKNIIYLSYTKS